jgi:predicted nucleic acid-binding protein
MNFYLDTNIYLNLWKKEGDPSKGIPYWKLAQDFMDKAEREGDAICFSGLILKELSYLIPAHYEEKADIIKATYQRAEVAKEDETYARKLESKAHFDISFYDCLHIALCKRLGLVLVTRDKMLLTLAKQERVPCGKPEDFL